jgi:hypothetical protein
MWSVNRPHGRCTDSNPDDVTAGNRTRRSHHSQLTTLTSTIAYLNGIAS